MVDQDLSLFHDTAPLFSVTEFGAPMPDSDRLGQAQTAAEWSEMFNQVHEFSNGYSSVGSGARIVLVSPTGKITPCTLKLEFDNINNIT